ncbi:MAG: hypothetical protein JSW58_13400 [Candidatus Latescibacterota bacterium]|nr:MAG: hypothetical protein JSW58_13400 [Candidatus Latescibacterota bacterium]
MRTQASDQLEFAFVEKQGQFVITRPLLKHRLRNSLLRKLYYVRRFFPELDGKTIRVGLTRVASGMAVPGGNELWLNPAQTSHHSLAHELVHLLQGTNDIPTGERSCDIFALARHWTLNDSPPYYVRLPAEFQTTGGKIRPEYAKLIYSIARRAVEMRKRGSRRYISYFEKTLENLKRRTPPETLSAPDDPTEGSKGE